MFKNKQNNKMIKSGIVARMGFNFVGVWIKLVILLSFYYFNHSIKAQTHTIFIDDTIFFTQKSPHSYFGEYNVTFKDSLSDGRWILHNLQRKDSLRKSNETIILTAEYRNFQKNGIFNYYGYHIDKGKKKRKGTKYKNYVKFSEAYQNDVLNGLVIEKQHGYNQTPTALKETRYENGKKNGLEVVYNYQAEYAGFLRGVNYYRNDTVIEWFNYFHDYKNIIAGHGLKPNNNEDYVYSEYNPNGALKAKYYYFNGNLSKYEKIDESQLLMIEMEGEFNECHKIYNKIQYNTNSYIVLHQIMLFDCDLKILNGTETVFDGEGEIILRNIYENGIVVELD